MKEPFRATKLTALLSGVVLSIGMPAFQAAGQFIGLSEQTQGLVYVLGLAVLFFAPVLVFVVGAEHLAIGSREMHKRTYWASLKQVGVRGIFWLLGGALGFAALSASSAIAAQRCTQVLKWPLQRAAAKTHLVKQGLAVAPPHSSMRPNPSLSPRPATAGAVSPAPAVRSIIGHRAYATCLRGRG